MPTALLWGAVAASSLIVGAVAGVVRDWHPRLIGLVLGFGAGALVASISFELAEEGFQVGGALPVAAGLAVGGLLFYLADLGVIRLGGRGGQAGLPLALGALLDGIPEQAVLGIGVASGGAVSISLLVAIFVSNLPEAIGSADDLKRAGRPASHILAGWSAVAAMCVAATAAGYLLQAFAGNEFQGGIDGFAAGALLVMLVTSMIPESTEKAGRQAGLAAVLGFAVAAGLSLSR
ncbi:ZIP family metal transporter [Mycolicibacterium phlei]|uniref:ZIP family metal transporter n=1 Tax=Mycolicibacterium phlei TaxID=1771 RepID=UPI00025AE252|nr:hypothetical protein [Mycolicibacterium phlei]EID09604.1 hypothetical protein MPHLEI_24394 [Mycolicibacterium phlei RIVM601174]MBF4191754.1 hypothetical protein [Mycolicibacterium phlei]